MIVTAFLGKLLAQNDVVLYLDFIEFIDPIYCSASSVIYSKRLSSFLAKHSTISPIHA
jgi:hypothetical protein